MMAGMADDLTPDEIKQAVDETIALLKSQNAPLRRQPPPPSTDTALMDRINRIRRQVFALAQYRDQQYHQPHEQHEQHEPHEQNDRHHRDKGT